MRQNVNKSFCLRFGPRFDSDVVDLVSLHGTVLKWVDSCRYLGVFLLVGIHLNVNSLMLNHVSFERSMLYLAKLVAQPRRRLC